MRTSEVSVLLVVSRGAPNTVVSVTSSALAKSRAVSAVEVVRFSDTVYHAGQ
jgi:hypothetical protein